MTELLKKDPKPKNYEPRTAEEQLALIDKKIAESKKQLGEEDNPKHMNRKQRREWERKKIAEEFNEKF